jgi:phage FluMu protein Com
MNFVEVKCQNPRCRKVLLEVSSDFYGLVRAKCRHCKRYNVVSLAVILKQSPLKLCYSNNSAPVR